MHPHTKEISKHMRDFGSYILGRAVVASTFGEILRPYAHAMAVTEAAHAAEIIIKARIVQEHPLLIFETLPKSKSTEDLLTINELLISGKTILYADLPERLWATTGYRMKRIEEFTEFGKLRNTIMHFAVPERELADEVLRFTFEVVDPLLQDFWQDSVIPYSEIWDDVVAMDGYLQERLNDIGIIQLTPRSKEILDDYYGRR